ncbi:MAG: transposase [Methanocalculaceae archaeon]|jgi:transposase-like protein|nr:transposase [Methanocalculaceae archaeon]
MLYKDFEEFFPNDAAAIAYFINIQYPDGMVCPHCGEKHLLYQELGKPKHYACKRCNNHFSVMRGTIFENSSTSMRMWFYAINAKLNGKKGISGRQLQRETGVTYKCAWRMLKLIRTAMGYEQERKMFEAIAEIGEMYWVENHQKTKT